MFFHPLSFCLMKSALLLPTPVITLACCLKSIWSLLLFQIKLPLYLISKMPAMIPYVPNSLTLIGATSCNDNVQTPYDTLIHQRHLVIDHYVPLKKSSNISPKRPLQIRKLLREKKKLYPICKINSLTKENYNRISKNYDPAVSHWCDQIESSICENPNLSKFYGFANRKLKAKGGCTQASDCGCNWKSPRFKRPASKISAAKSSNYAHCVLALRLL